MKIAIISDSHDNLPNIYKALEWINKNDIKEIIHCGDVCAPGALREIAENFKGKIHLAYGNVDGDHEGMERMRDDFKNIILYGEKGEMEIGKNGGEGKECEEGIECKEGDGDKFQISNFKFQKNIKDQISKGDSRKDAGIKVAFCHFPREAKDLAKSGKYDFVFYGHTHKPWEEMIGKCKMLNPGTLAGMFYKATFAVWDVAENKMELKILERL